MTADRHKQARIVVVGPVPPPLHGVAVVTRNLLESPLLNETYELVHVDTSDRRGISNVGRYDAENIRLAGFHAWTFLRTILRKRPHLVYLPLAESVPAIWRDLLFVIPARLLRLPLVIHLHGSGIRRFFGRSSLVVRWALRASLGHAAVVIVLGEGLRTLVDGLVSPDRVVTVANGSEDVSSGSIGRRRGERDHPTVLFLSNLMARKGVFVLLKAADAVLKVHPNAGFVFAGDWFREDERKRALREIDRIGSRSFTLLGPVGSIRKRELLLGTSALAFPTIGPEGFPLVILEAMSAGVPVVASDQGAIPEVIVDGVTGYVVPAGDVDTLSQRLIDLLSDDGLREAMGAAARRRFMEMYTTERWAARMDLAFAHALTTAGDG